MLLRTLEGPREGRREARARLGPLGALPAPADRLLAYAASRLPQDDPERPRLQGVLRHTWLANQTRLDLARRLTTALAAHGPVWLDDLVLCLRAYPHISHRPIGHLSLLVSDLDGARQALRSLGYPATRPGLHRVEDTNLHLYCGPLPNRDFPPEVDHDELPLLSAELQLLRLCLTRRRYRHGLWATDLLCLSRRIAPPPSRYRATLAVWRSFQILRGLGLPVPPWPLAWWRAGLGEWLELALGERRLCAWFLR